MTDRGSPRTPPDGALADRLRAAAGDAGSEARDLQARALALVEQVAAARARPGTAEDLLTADALLPLAAERAAARGPQAVVELAREAIAALARRTDEDPA